MSNILNVKKEVSKCTQCGCCKNACPLGIFPKDMISFYLNGQYEELINYLYDKNPFSEICGYICPNKFCVNKCIRNKINEGVNIKGLQEYFCNEYKDLLKTKCVSHNGKIVAVVGAGISGLTASWWLKNKGFRVILFEKESRIGGELNLIPEERLPRDAIERDFKRIFDDGMVEIHLNESFDRNDEYETVFYCIGSRPNKLEIEGIENAIYYDEYLKSERKIENVAIIGGGNVAFDCAMHNLGNTTMFVRRNYWDMRIDNTDFTKLIERHITVVSTFTPEKIENMTLFGTFDGNKYSKKFDKIVIAIGRKPLLAKYEKPINVIVPADSVVETVASTIKQLEEYYEF